MRRRLRLLPLLAPLALCLALAAAAQAGAAPSLPLALPAPLAPRLAPFTLAADQPALQTDDFGSAGVVTDDERLRFAFDGFGRLSSRTLERRTGASSWLLEQSQARAYFANGLLESLETRGPAGQLLASHTLSYLAGGRFEDANRTQDSFRLLGPDAAAPCRTAACTASFAYDGPGRLVQAADGTGTTAAFSLDAAGNVTAERRGGVVYRSASYAGGRLASETSAGGTRRFLYDGQGNLDCLVAASWAASSCPAAASGQPVAPELLADYAYDYRDRLVASQAYAGGVAGDRSETRYDPLGRPLSSLSTLAGATTATSLVYLGLSQAVVQETQSGAVSASRSFAFDALGGRATLAQTVAGATSRFSYVEDAHGSAELLLDQAGEAKAAYAYSAYGEENAALTRAAAGFDAGANPYRYGGKRLDAASGLYDMGARHYRPGSGRFLQPDRYPQAAADLSLSLDPLAANRYALAGGNPVNYIEADGHRVVEDAGLGGASPPGCMISPSICGDGVVATNDLDYVLMLAGGAGTAAKLATRAAKPIAGLVGRLLRNDGELERIARAAARERAAQATRGAIETSQGLARQGTSAAAMAARKEVEQGAVLWRIGTTGKSKAGEAEFWSLEHPLSPGFAKRYGIPEANVRNADFIESAVVPRGGTFITREAPGIGVNTGGGIEVVVRSGGIRMRSFSYRGPR